MKQRILRFYKGCAFTIVELLVAMAILGLIVVLATQMVSLLQQTVRTSTQASDCDIEAHQVFRRLRTDIDNLIQRADVFYASSDGSPLFLSSPASPLTGAKDSFLNFYAFVPGYEGNRSVAQVAWRVNENEDGKLQLERGVAGTFYNGGTRRLELFPTSASPTLAPINEVDYQVIGTGVFRFEIGYVYEENSGTGSQWRVSGTLPPSKSLKDVSSLFIRMVLMDSKALELLTNAQTTTISNKFPSLAAQGEPLDVLAESWKEVIENGSLTDNGLPSGLTTGIHVYERIFPLP